MSPITPFEAYFFGIATGCVIGIVAAFIETCVQAKRSRNFMDSL